MPRNAGNSLHLNDPQWRDLPPLGHGLGRDIAKRPRQRRRAAYGFKNSQDRCAHERSESISFIILQASLSETESEPFAMFPVMKEVGDRIRHVRILLGLTQLQFAEKLGVTRGAVGNWELNKGVKAANITQISDATGAAVDWLANGRGMTPRTVADLESPQHDNILQVPVISAVSAGQLQSIEGDAERVALRFLTVAGLPSGDWLAMEVEGSSMNRISPDGSVILVNRRERRLVPNACYVIATAENGHTTYKRYRPGPDRFEPVSTEPEHEAIFPEGPVRVIGRVRRSIIDM